MARTQTDATSPGRNRATEATPACALGAGTATEGRGLPAGARMTRSLPAASAATKTGSVASSPGPAATRPLARPPATRSRRQRSGRRTLHSRALRGSSPHGRSTASFHHHCDGPKSTADPRTLSCKRVPVPTSPASKRVGNKHQYTAAREFALERAIPGVFVGAGHHGPRVSGPRSVRGWWLLIRD